MMFLYETNNREKRLITLRSPIKVNFEITSKCTLQCCFCSVYPSENEKHFVPLNHLKKVADAIISAEVFSITLYGGEPFIYPWIIEIAEYLKNHNRNVGFVSSGFPITREKVEKICEFVDGGSISIHGFETTHDAIVGKKGAWKRAVRAIKFFNDVGIPVSLCLTLINQNIKEACSFLDFAASDLGVSEIVINRFVPHGLIGKKNAKILDPSINTYNRTLLNIKRYFDTFHPKVDLKIVGSLPLCKIDPELRQISRSCTVGVSFAGIDMMGNLKLCSATPFIIGNILEKPLEELWQNSSMLQEFRSMKWANPQCLECEWFESCFCGCKTTSDEKPFSMDVKFFGDGK